MARSVFNLPPGAVYCLSPNAVAKGLRGEDYRRAPRAQAARGEIKAIEVGLLGLESESVHSIGRTALAVNRDPARFLAALGALGEGKLPADFLHESQKPEGAVGFPRVVTWTLLDHPANNSGASRVIGCFLPDSVRCRPFATLRRQGMGMAQNVESVRNELPDHVACFPAPNNQNPGDATLSLERYTESRISICRRPFVILAAKPRRRHPARTTLFR